MAIFCQNLIIKDDLLEVPINFINVLGRLTGISDSTKNYAIKGDGIIQVSGTLEYHEGTFLNDFTGTMEIGSGGFLKLGNTQNRLASLAEIKVTEGGQIGGWGTAKPADVTLNLSGGTLTTTGANLEYSGAIIVTADSFLAPSGSEELTVSGDITNQNNARITSTGTVILSGAVTLGDLTVQSGSLNLGKVAGNAYAAKKILVGDVTVNAGATFSVGYTKGTVESVSLAAGAKLRYYDNQTPLITEASDTTTIKKLTVSAAATLQADWKGTLNISELTGAGNLALSKYMGSGAFYLNVDTIKDYSGTISGPTSNGSLMTVTIGGANISDAASTATVSANVTLKNGFTKTGAGAIEFSGNVDANGATISAGTLSFGGTVKITSGKSIVVSSDQGVSLTHDGFTYNGTTITTPTAANALSLFDNATVTNGTLTQTANASDVAYKNIGATLTNVKLANIANVTTWLSADATLSALDIAGTLVVKSDTSVSGVATVSGTLKVDSGKSLKLTGQDTTSSITTLTGSGTLKTTGGTTEIANASGFTGSLEVGANSVATIKNSVSGSADSTIATLTGSGTLKTTGGKTKVATATGFTGTLAATGGNIELQSATALALSEVVVSGGSSITVVDTVSDVLSISASKVSIGAGAAGSLVGILSIKDNGTITLDASAGKAGTGLALSSPITTFADEGSTSTTVSLTLGSGLTLNLLNLNVKQGDSLTLFSGVTGVTGVGDMDALEAGNLEAKTVFTNLTEGDFKLSYSNNIVALVAQRAVPEPTTATLSLLALMGLAARRRRRKA